MTPETLLEGVTAILARTDLSERNRTKIEAELPKLEMWADPSRNMNPAEQADATDLLNKLRKAELWVDPAPAPAPAPEAASAPQAPATTKASTKAAKAASGPPDASDLAIPARLKALPRWLLHRDKKPHYADGQMRHGELDTPEDIARLVSYADARAALVKKKGSGLGFAIVKGDGIIGIDADKVLGNEHEPAATALLGNTYIERSPSGKGLHAFYIGEFSPERKRVGPFECYSEKRFFTVTGDRIATSMLDVADARPEDIARLATCFGTASAKTTGEAHLPGGLGSVINDADEARLRDALKHIDASDRPTWLAVCGALAGSGEPGFKLFHDWSSTAASGYKSKADCRKKFDELAKAPKSGYPAIFKMAQARGWSMSRRVGAEAAQATAAGFRFVPFRESIDSDAAPRWVLKNWLERDTLTCIAGQPKHGKSFVAFDMALHVAAGIPWCGNRVEQGSVFVICGEGQGGVSRRLKGWLNKHPAVGKDLPFFTSSRSIQLTGEGALAVREHIDALRLEHGEPAVVIIDTLARSFPGDENKNEDMSAFVAALDGHIKSLGAAVVLVHHATKSGSDVLRGASALRGALDGLVEVLRADSPSASGGIVVEVRPHFLKDGATPESLYFDCEVVATGTDEDLEEITTLVPKLMARPGAAVAALNNDQRQALGVLHTMQGPDAGIGVPLREWRDACVEAGVNLGQGGQRAREGAMERLTAALSAAACVFKPGGNDGKYQAVPFVDFDELHDE